MSVGAQPVFGRNMSMHACTEMRASPEVTARSHGYLCLDTSVVQCVAPTQASPRI